MRILLYRGDGVIEPWARDFAKALPQAETVVWQERLALLPCDYAVLWAPEPALLEQLAHVKAIFLMGAGVDAILKFGDALPDVPVIRLGDAGMGEQMAEYVAYAVLRYFRRFDEYEQQAHLGVWNPLAPRQKQAFTVGVLGLGKLGIPVVKALHQLGFPVRGWSRTAKALPGVDCYAGMASLGDFLAGTRVLVCMLPLTPETTNLLDRACLSQLPEGAYLINVARGAQVAEPDLMSLIRAGHIAGATLDVFRNEPLPAPHPFWNEPRITITPHISALTVREEAVRQIAHKITLLEQGEEIADIVDRNLGY
ncbi:glyoxylate reductase [Massilia sp. WF1]|uniref:2-hydroxyacid dehydrogenase n=1 Tax=unclassified Massilia TaxID=2609279 RepID=UPI00064A33B6|nr:MULTISPECIES: glyoxylate/hydroxypyruvate reductase A [unclassified Massilia]ALK95045.1 glyoxylate/hydroxypyruvate reductase A [Massilia sp. WG5]KLU35345.1 glyoxylate reductase [Massilia sp. WF1]